jgi:CBS domain-containing protein
MTWINKNDNKNIPELPSIDKISTEIPSVSEYLDAFRLPMAFKQAESDTLPVIDVTGKIVGIVSEYDLAKLLPEWSFEEGSYKHQITVKDIMTKDVWTEPEHTNIKNLLSQVHEMHIRVIPIVDNDGRYTGRSITRTDLISYLTRMVKPLSIGGLATPLGVSMTDGQNLAGPGQLGFVLTGVSFAVIIVLIQVITGILFGFIKVNYFIVIFTQLFLFIIILRLTPFSRYHAAEHQTIHAIEKGLPLTVETVRMQPRPHKRCGTNLLVLLVGIQFILLLSLPLSRFGPFFQFVFMIAGFLIIFSNWRKAGMILQKYFTTAPASDKQIQNGINVGEKLLKKHKENLDPNPPDFFQKIWNMGLIQILFSFLLVSWIFDYILSLL